MMMQGGQKDDGKKARGGGGGVRLPMQMEGIGADTLAASAAATFVPAYAPRHSRSGSREDGAPSAGAGAGAGAGADADPEPLLDLPSPAPEAPPSLLDAIDVFGMPSVQQPVQPLLAQAAMAPPQPLTLDSATAAETIDWFDIAAATPPSSTRSPTEFVLSVGPRRMTRRPPGSLESRGPSSTCAVHF